MKARQLIEKSSFDPDQVKTMGVALDDTWVRMAPSVDNRPEAVQAARFALADIILGLAVTEISIRGGLQARPSNTPTRRTGAVIFGDLVGRLEVLLQVRALWPIQRGEADRALRRRRPAPRLEGRHHRQLPPAGKPGTWEPSGAHFPDLPKVM
jgi:hypothetical protein